MITKGIVEELISPYAARVRIPILDNVTNTSYGTRTEDLPIATICSLPNCTLNPQVGDIVFVAFEYNAIDKVVILGYLSAAALNDTLSDANFGNIDVSYSARLPEDTTIGSITPQEISFLSGLTDNIQKQLNSLKEQQDIILSQLS